MVEELSVEMEKSDYGYRQFNPIFLFVQFGMFLTIARTTNIDVSAYNQKFDNVCDVKPKGQ